jgi:hypothetical protein
VPNQAPIPEKPYTRSEILDILRILDADEMRRAVLVRGGRAVAIVVNAPGRHPSRDPYWNDLTDTVFVMEGEPDGRGSLIQDPRAKIHLFFADFGQDKYAYKGLLQYDGRVDEELTRVTRRPRRKYKRI